MMTDRGNALKKGSAKLRVLHIVTVPLGMSGLPLFALRVGGAMTDVRADYLSYGIPDASARELVKEQGAELYIAPHRLRHPIKYMHYVSNVIKNNRYDVVHCHGNSSTMFLDLVAAKLGGSAVRIAHSHNTRTGYPLLHIILKPLFHRSYTHAMACGKEAGEWLFQSRAFTIIPNGISAELFHYDAATAAEVRQELAKDPNERLIGWAGSFNIQKNLRFLLDVFTECHTADPSLRLVLIGDGPQKDEILQIIRERALSDAVYCIGIRRDMPRLLMGMDAMVLPSLYEGFPTVALEWQCSGVTSFLSDTITPDCVLTSFVQRIPLEKDKWIEALTHLPSLDRALNSEDGICRVRDAGYDISSTAELLQALYLEYAGTYVKTND